jgi:hypothetical protein
MLKRKHESFVDELVDKVRYKMPIVNNCFDEHDLFYVRGPDPWVLLIAVCDLEAAEFGVCSVALVDTTDAETVIFATFYLARHTRCGEEIEAPSFQWDVGFRLSLNEYTNTLVPSFRKADTILADWIRIPPLRKIVMEYYTTNFSDVVAWVKEIEDVSNDEEKSALFCKDCRETKVAKIGLDTENEKRSYRLFCRSGAKRQTTLVLDD